MTLTIIVGTGRCGSTMLSGLLHQHPDVLSMSEFFGSVWTSTPYFPANDMDGRELWELLASPDPVVDAMIGAGYGIPEFRYPYGHGRFDVTTSVPRICHMTLPALTDDPDTLFDDLAAVVPTWPRRTGPEQVRALFGYLAGRLRRSAVAERTAASLAFAALLRQLFPDARFVHMYRDGPDCALSMRRHLGIRVLGLAEEAGLLRWGSPALAPLAPPSAPLVELLSPPFDVTEIMTFPAPPLATFGRLWSRMVTFGEQALGDLATGQIHPLRYEDLLADPRGELTKLADFIGVEASGDWLSACGPLVDQSKVGQAARLPADEAASLRAACEPGAMAIKSWHA